MYKRIVDNILEKVDTFQNQGSGWQFYKVNYLDIHIDEYQPIAAKSYIDLTKKLKLKKAIIIPKNEDNQCFKWIVKTAVYPAKRDQELITKLLKTNCSTT